MYLSCYVLDISFLEVRRALQNSYEMHRSVMSAFEFKGDIKPRRDMSVLYRLVTMGRNHILYVSSAVEPIGEMPAGFNKKMGSPKDISGVVATLIEGGILCFNLMAMPSKKIHNPESKNSKRVFLGKAADRKDWLLKKAAQNGFEVLSFHEEGASDNKIMSAGYKSIIFKGVLRIIDKERFCNAYKNGIGAEKAFGCGMLLLSKLL